MESVISLIVFLPLFAALITGLSVRVISVQRAQLLTCAAMLLSALLAAYVFSEFAGAADNWRNIFGPSGLIYKVPLATWIDSGDFTTSWTLRVDALTAVMLVVVTFVSAAVHVYSVGYMSHDPHPQRFMAYLSLFTFFMLMLVTADDFLQLFLGWEGVGLSSYLLIGFWFEKPAPCAAAIKAFLVNRIGDIGFALGICAVFVLFGTVKFDAVFANASGAADLTLHFMGMDFPALTVTCILLFIGAMGKSAQVPLHTWLPDAMEGPTPVSALIHAATMVTAGVFLVARCSPLFQESHDAMAVVTVVGAFTALFAATIGLVQNDIKRVIAYSTCSQLGYMFFACGVGAYAAAMFHLMTHAFFKALLFLGAGSVIHGMGGEQDMRGMGGIWRKMPITYAYMWIGSLALAGIPFFAGYFSKDMILEAAYAAGGLGVAAYWMGIAAACMTAFYSWRLLFMTFHGKPRASAEVMSHVHESPAVMLNPLVILALGAIFAGYIGAVQLHMISGTDAFWQNTIASHDAIEAAHQGPEWVGLMALAAAITGIAIAYVLYMFRPALATKLASALSPLYTLFLNKWYVDELYEAIFTAPAKRLGRWLWKQVDMRIIDDLGPNGAASLSRRIGDRVAHLQTGYVYHYAFAMLAGVLVMVSWVVWHGR